MNHQEFYSNLTDDLRAKIKACKSKDEMQGVLKDANIELDSDVMDSIWGGSFLPDDHNSCPPHLRDDDQVGCSIIYRPCPPHLRDDDQVGCSIIYRPCPPHLR